MTFLISCNNIFHLSPHIHRFSIIYYPKGWKAWIEPAGKYGEVRGGHYRPTASSIILILLLLASAAGMFVSQRKNNQTLLIGLVRNYEIRNILETAGSDLYGRSV